MLNIGIVGCGTIGTELCKAISGGIIKDARLVAIFDKHIRQTEKLASTLQCTPAIEEPSQMAQHVDIIIECASVKAVPEVARAALTHNCDLMLMSIGALADNTLKEELIALARAHNAKIYIPSGAIAGVDGIKGAGIAGIHRITLKTRKPPASLEGAPYLEEHHINLDTITTTTLLFSGSVRDATAAFPANINVATTLSLASGNSDIVQVEIYADPHIDKNIHEITVEGGFGTFTATIENQPSPTNPKTSYLAVLSAIATLKQLTEPLHIGT